MEVTGQMKESRLEQGKKKNAQRYRYMPIPMSILFLTPLDSSHCDLVRRSFLVDV